jgi:hypothetical protein
VPDGTGIKYNNKEVINMSEKDRERLFHLFEQGRISLEELKKYLNK